MVQQIQSLAEFETFIGTHKLVVVDCYAEWCGPCKLIAPKIEQFSKDYKDIQFIKVDVDVSEDLSSHLGVTAMPTFFLFHNKEKVGKVIGANAALLEKEIKNLLSKFQK